MDDITFERWQSAQVGERNWHTKKGCMIDYGQTYENYFKYLGINPDLKGKRIIEIGCADTPALKYCYNYGQCTIIEPMFSPRLDLFVLQTGIKLIKEPAEYVEAQGDEAWLFNVLQHVISPDKIIENMKRSVSIIRFFEPIEIGTCQKHPHSFILDDFKNWFGDCVQYYPPNPECTTFHTNQCAYGNFHATR